MISSSFGNSAATAAERSVSRPRSWSRRWVRVVLLLAVALGLAWAGRRVLLAGMGRLLVREDPVQPAAVIVVSSADLIADAIEAGRLYRAGVSGAIVLPTVPADPVQDEVRRLGGLGWGPTEYARWLIERSGVPASAITILPNPVDGTGAEIAELAAFAERSKPASLLYITSRTHTARAGRLLAGALPAQIHLMVRSPSTETFCADSWWRSREQARALTNEYLRWVNSFILGDLWAR